MAAILTDKFRVVLAEKFKDAIACFKKSILLNPHFLEARVNLGNIYIEQKCVDEAINQFIKTNADLNINRSKNLITRS